MVKLEKQDYIENKQKYNQFERELRTKLGEGVCISHVGSTAIPEIEFGKNIIDVLVSAKNEKELLELSEKILSMGFYYSGNTTTDVYRFFASHAGETSSGDIHIHLAIEDSERYQEFLILKDYLLSHKNEAVAYSNLKVKLLENNVVERREYRKQKSEYVSNLISRAKEYHKNNKI